jgi:hypothetical protein
MNNEAAKNLTAAVPYEPQQSANVVEGDFRPRVILPGTGRLLDDSAADFARELRPREIFSHNGSVVVLDAAGNVVGITPSAFRSWVSSPNHGAVVPAILVTRKDEDGLVTQEKIDADLTKDQSDGVLACPRFIEGLRPLDQVHKVRLPTKRNNGIIELLPHGYDEASAILTRPGIDYSENMPLAEAKLVLEELLQEWRSGPITMRRTNPARWRCYLRHTATE